MFVHPSVAYGSSLRGANTIQLVCSTEALLCYHGSPSQSISVRRKTCHASVQLLFGMIALFVGRELLFSSFRRFPLKRGNGVAVFEGSPIRYNNAFIQPFFTLV